MHEENIIIKSNLLSQFPGITHGISTKSGGFDKPPFFNNLSYVVGDDKNNVKSNREKFFGSLNIDMNNLAIPKQIHSSNIRIINESGSYPETDALITNSKNIFLVISVADCYPVLIYDRKNQIVSAVHSGWRGTQKRILTHAIKKMYDDFKSVPADLFVFIGPGISNEYFEVGEEVASQFDDKYCEGRNGKYFINLRANIIDQLDNMQIPANNIDIHPMCTYKEKDYLHSYRRDKDKSGRMFAVIGISS
jgi:hypothetical protein